VAPEPVGELLSAGGFRVGVVAGPQDADEKFDLDDLAGRGIDKVRVLPGVVDEDLLPGRCSWRMLRRCRASQRRYRSQKRV
jgi:hypothetical protein